MTQNKKTKKVALFCDFLNSLGGCEYYNVLLAKCLIKRNIDVRVYIGERPRDMWWLNQLKRNGIFFRSPRTYHVDLEDRNIEINFISGEVQNINRWRPDIIHAHPFGKLAISWLENKKSNKKIPVVVTEYTVPSENTSHWFNKEQSVFSHHISAYIATCQAVERGIRNYLKYSGPVIRIPHLITPAPAKKIKMGNIFSVGCIARLSPEKGLSSLILAWYFLRKKIKKATLHIYGTGADERYLTTLVKCLDLSNSIFFNGSYEPFRGIHTVANNHMIFVQPSHFESIPTTIIELMLRQRIVVATNVGGIPELINHDNGFIYDNASVETLAQKLENIFALPKARLVMIAKNARKTIAKTYDLERTVQAIIDVYDKQITRKQLSDT